MNDTRNLTDELKGRTENAIIALLDENEIELEVAVENLERDFNMGTIVRSANAFGVRRVHVIGRRGWNKRGAMATEKYLHVLYHASVDEFMDAMQLDDREVIAVDNVKGSNELHNTQLSRRCVLVFGSEGAGISNDLLHGANRIVAIEQLGSTRSINVGVAAGVVMYRWLQDFYLKS